MKEVSFRDRFKETLKRFRTSFVVHKRRTASDSDRPPQEPKNLSYLSAPSSPTRQSRPEASAFSNPQLGPTSAFENETRRKNPVEKPVARATTGPPGMIETAALDLFGQPSGATENCEKGDACPICFTEMAGRTVYETECGHRFHNCCITGWLNTAPSSGCPMCRTPISLRPLSEAVWRTDKYEFATAQDIKENMAVVRRIIKEVDERNRNFGSRAVKLDGVEVPYFVTGRIRMLMQSHMSLYYIVFVWDGKVYEANVDTGKSMAYYMRLDVKLLDSIEFDIQYVDH